jgi:hypothetical protein
VNLLEYVVAMWRQFFCKSREPGETKRFFYHSFPRRGRNTSGEIDKGCQILSLICDVGLVLAPEVVPWSYPHADGTPPREQRTIQRRIYFTELAPHELKRHAEEFGHFALEFEVDALGSTASTSTSIRSRSLKRSNDQRDCPAQTAPGRGKNGAS